MKEMSEREKYLFDLQGFLVVRDFLTPEEVAALNESVDANIDVMGEDGNSHTGESTTLVGKKRGMFTGMLSWPKPWCNPFRDIVVHPKLLPYLNTIHGRGWRLDHQPFILTADKGTEGLRLHGPGMVNFDGSQYYIYTNGQMRCGMVVFQFQLADVNEGDGGLAVIPGSHKANLACPEKIKEWEMDQDIVYNVPAKAGDLIIFNEATTHGTLPWTADHDRRSLLVRYSPKYLHFAGGYYETSFPEWVDELTEAQRAVLEPPYIYNRPLIEDDGVSVIYPRRE